MHSLQLRIEKLEFELVHQQRTTEQLNEIVVEQTRELMRLQRAIDRLAKQLDDVRKAPSDSLPPPTLEEEKPPHY